MCETRPLPRRAARSGSGAGCDTWRDRSEVELPFFVVLYHIRGCVYTLLVCTVGSGWLHSPRRGLREIVPCVVHVARVARAPVSAQVVSGASLAKSQNRNADAARNRQRCHPLPLHPSCISLDPPPSLCTTLCHVLMYCVPRMCTSPSGPGVSFVLSPAVASYCWLSR